MTGRPTLALFHTNIVLRSRTYGIDPLETGLQTSISEGNGQRGARRDGRVKRVDRMCFNGPQTCQHLEKASTGRLLAEGLQGRVRVALIVDEKNVWV